MIVEQHEIVFLMNWILCEHLNDSSIDTSKSISKQIASSSIQTPVQNWFHFEVGHNFKNPSCNVFTYLPSKRNQNRIYLLKFDIQSHRTLESESDNEGKPGMEEKSSTRLWFGAAKQERPGAPFEIEL